jgi:hypothetical protein
MQHWGRGRGAWAMVDDRVEGVGEVRRGREGYSHAGQASEYLY